MPLPPFPSALLDWAGHRKGGVRRLFYNASGRPSGTVIYTNLLDRLAEWSKQLGGGKQVPRVVLLVGGPGNGKTDAVEFTVEAVDRACQLEGKLTSAFTAQFIGSNDKPPRLAQVDLAPISGGRFPMHMAIVQDASAVDQAVPDETAAGWLVRDLAQFALADCGCLYLACVNRGVLDDALIHAIDTQQREVQTLLETVTQSVGIGRDVPDGWPLDGYPNVAVWPMDVESLVGAPADPRSPMNQLLAIATKAEQWPFAGTCAAGEHCPFCSNRSALAEDDQRRSFLQILRWYELATGKRWSFRDLFSLVSYVLAGVPPVNGKDGAYNPCQSAAHLWEPWGKQGTTRQESLRLAAPFLLVASQYQHALFGDWPRADTKRIRASLKAVQLDAEPGLKGLYWFLARPRGSSLPATLAQQLTVLCDVLDPALADPDAKVLLSIRRAVKFREIDARFSQSVSEGYRFIKRSNCLTPLENHLMELLEQSDAELTKEETERRDPVAARYLRTVIRDFSCRLMRRSLGVRSGVVRDADILADYEKVVGGDAELINQAVNQITNLLNTNEKFTVSLSTTFGEPTPSPERMATLRTDKQKVTSPPVRERNHPAQPIRFLSVGARPQHIPLTYELFRSIRGLVQGLVPASLPRSVVALLDTTRARMAGSIVRDEDMLNGSHIKLGSSKQGVARQVGKFVVVGD